jgi:4-aminobutyrate aminotransferase-like enzyme
LGVDFWLPAGTPVHSLYDAEVYTAVNDKGYKEYGGLIILKHHEENITFYTLYGHLSAASAAAYKVGDRIKKGDCIGYLGTPKENGEWSPHLHFQVMLTMLNFTLDFPGVCYPSEIGVFKSLCPDPNLLFKNEQLKTSYDRPISDLLHFRNKHLGKSLSVSYKEPLHIVRGDGVYLLDPWGQKYLDTVNNVAHVGHENPKVVFAGQRQMALLNTNTRYLNEEIKAYAEALLATLPKELSVLHFVNSGSEANELAIRMAKTATKKEKMLAIEIGYHGNTNAVIDVSSYKFDGKGGKGKPKNTYIMPMPDPFRGMHRGDDCGSTYATYAEKFLSKPNDVAAFIGEPIISCGGQIVPPKGYFKEVYRLVRESGGLCIADEVQTGFGRVGSAFWAFELHDVIPDIVTMGKPIGNGHPLAAVACTKEVAETFANGMEFFNTFGGNPVSCAIGRTVLEVIQEEKLQENALKTGDFLKKQLLALQSQFSIIGEVRGEGLFLGFELVSSQLTPLPKQTSYLVNRMKEFNILMSSDGPNHNVIKIKPPIVFNIHNAKELIFRLKQVFEEDFMQPSRA